LVSVKGKGGIPKEKNWGGCTGKDSPREKRTQKSKRDLSDQKKTKGPFGKTTKRDDEKTKGGKEKRHTAKLEGKREDEFSQGVRKEDGATIHSRLSMGKSIPVDVFCPQGKKNL